MLTGKAGPAAGRASPGRWGSAIPSVASGSKEGRATSGCGPQKRLNLTMDRPLFISGPDWVFVALAENT